MVVSLNCYFMLLVGSYCFFKVKNHILMMLLNLELLSVIVLLMMIEFFSLFSYDLLMIIYMIIIMVCEAVIGLVLLTLFIRTHGGDYFKSSSLLMC